ncbi:MAG: patatin-like phospholipase family protein [Alphaproteobacteria bacterium]|nr:patatin-like phospholipase family protein [Alphaproteobacteria bacterium]OJV13607.1 MAG: hypothetical protein BGO27_03220 [Alphaproteobacteria bacterium 33-17]
MIKNIIITVFTSVCLLSCKPSNNHLDFNYYPNVEQNREIKNVRVALVLGGGGARGAAHAGVLEVLEKHNIPVDLIVGTSAGSIVGALYADSKSASDVKEKILSVSKWYFLDPALLPAIKWGLTTSGVVEGKRFQKFLEKNLDARNIEDLKIPAVFVATDIRKQDSFGFNKGAIIPGVIASSAIPGVIPPLEIYNRVFTDGGLIEPVPVQMAKKYNPDLIIAVDITIPPIMEEVKNTLDFVYWSFWLAYAELGYVQGNMGDVTIRPELGGFGIFNDSKEDLEKMYLRGKEAAEKQIHLIKVKMKAKGIN